LSKAFAADLSARFGTGWPIACLENWQVIAVSQTGDLIVANLGNPEIIAAYQAGVPRNGKPCADGSKMANVHWKARKSAEADGAVGKQSCQIMLQAAMLAGKDTCQPFTTAVQRRQTNP
jgi:hypothetical protein